MLPHIVDQEGRLLHARIGGPFWKSYCDLFSEKTVSPVVRKLLEAAGQDVKVAERLLPSSPDHAAFWACQATETLAHAMCALEEISDSDAKDVAQIAGRLPGSNLFKTNLLSLAYLSAKATEIQWLDRAEGNRVSPPSQEVGRLVKRIKSIHGEICRWLPTE